MAPIKPLTTEQVSALIEEQALTREDLLDSLRQIMEIRALEDNISEPVEQEPAQGRVAPLRRRRGGGGGRRFGAARR